MGTFFPAMAEEEEEEEEKVARARKPTLGRRERDI